MYISTDRASSSSQFSLAMQGFAHNRHRRYINGRQSPSALEKARNELFLAVVRPHKQVYSSTISRWLKSLLDKAGIDAGIFKAHSTHSTAVSAAANTGMTS